MTIDWLQSQQMSLAFTTYQSSRLILLGVNPQGQMSGFERIFDRAMGLYFEGFRLLYFLNRAVLIRVLVGTAHPTKLKIFHNSFRTAILTND